MHHIKAAGFLLRPFEERDAAEYVRAVHESTGSVGRWMPWCNSEYNEANALDWFKVCHQTAISGSAHQFGVFSEASGEFIGGAGLNQIRPQHGTCNLEYWVRESRQRQGAATACIKALAEYGFMMLKLQRIEILVAVGNSASSAVALRAGALFEGTARNRLIINGETLDANVYSLIP